MPCLKAIALDYGQKYDENYKKLSKFVSVIFISLVNGFYVRCQEDDQFAVFIGFLKSAEKVFENGQLA